MERKKPRKRMVIRVAGIAYYVLSKTSLRQLMECVLKHFLMRWFSHEIPHNIYSVIGILIHDFAKNFWDTNWKSVDSLAGAAFWRWQNIYKERLEDELGRPVLDEKGKEQWVFKKEPNFQKRPIEMRKLEEDYYWGLAKLQRCARNLAIRFWGKPRPIQEHTTRFRLDGVLFEVRFDLLFKRDPRDGKWYIGEIKTGREPRWSHWEATLCIMAWCFLIRSKPKIRRYLQVPDEIYRELLANPYAVYKYVGMMYFLFDRDIPGGEQKPQYRKPSQWFELVRSAKDRQRDALGAQGALGSDGVGEIPVNRDHCDACYARVICDQYLKQVHGMEETYKPEKLLDPGLALAGPDPRGPAGQALVFNWKYGRLRVSTKRKHQMRWQPSEVE